MSEWRPGEPRTPFSATDAAFAGFGLIKRDPGSIVAWGLCSLVLLAMIFGVMAWGLAPALHDFMAGQAAGAPPSPATIANLNMRIAPFQLLNLGLSLVFYPVILAGVYRAMLAPRPGFGHLRLGRAEGLQLLALLLVGVTIFVVYLVGVVGLILGSAIVAATVSKAAGILTAVLGGLTLVAAVIFLAVRLSFVGPASFDAGELRFRKAWAMTRGRFWPLLGAYLLACVLAIMMTLAVIVVFLIIAAPIVIASHGGLSGALRQTQEPSALLVTLGILYVVIISALNGVLSGVVFGAPADAYRQLQPAAAPTLGIDDSHRFGPMAAPPEGEFPIVPPNR